MNEAHVDFLLSPAPWGVSRESSKLAVVHCCLGGLGSRFKSAVENGLAGRSSGVAPDAAESCFGSQQRARHPAGSDALAAPPAHSGSCFTPGERAFDQAGAREAGDEGEVALRQSGADFGRCQSRWPLGSARSFGGTGWEFRAEADGGVF